jgi:antitoxin ParD1/3/4
MESGTEKMSISLPPKLAAMVRAAVSEGDYASTSEVVRDALRVWRGQQQSAGDRMIDAIGIEEVRRLWHEGLASGPGTSGSIDDIIARAETRYNDDRA